MKKIFRKAITVLGSAALIGMTVGAASAAAYLLVELLLLRVEMFINLRRLLLSFT
jgi:hypothetical protein